MFPEDDSALAWNLTRSYSFIAPQLIYAECANLIWKKARRGELTPTEAEDAAAFVNDFAIETVALKELVSISVDLSLRLDHAAYDCFYLALAVLQDCPFITADGRFHRKTHATLEQIHADRCMLLASFAA